MLLETKVLIVEDEAVLASTLAVGLKPEGFLVVHAVVTKTEIP